ncbi:hypothetical protein [Planococcus sp. 107-1]|uniref:hypothetical protein n=1 Tax=Planococcus sp. 107-1 TaxID=2908840 RepID=UPI001F3A6159|nr:hypothetical protein [Planococcus sp. 107-1]UJF27967.1 hypothetical protein L0M13_06105 [Planococcus sp. 107-1]
MKTIYSFESVKAYEKYQGITESFNKRLLDYQKVMEKDFALTELPKAFVWTSAELATTVFSEVPIPRLQIRMLFICHRILQNGGSFF